MDLTSVSIYPKRIEAKENTEITILNSMAGSTFKLALDQHVSWGIKYLDLKDAIWGKSIVGLTKEEAEQAAVQIDKRDLSVYCFSTVLFGGDIELGEERFRQDSLEKIDHVIEIAKILQPQMIRLLAAATSKRGEIENSVKYLHTNHPWLIPLYAEAIDRLHDRYYAEFKSNPGGKVTIENEVGNCIFSTPEEIIDFFETLDRRERVSLTWDVQNLWQMGTYPTLDVYYKLKRLISYYHLKGGQQSDENSDLYWRSSLEDASWPVVEITRQVVMDDLSQMICLNVSHGQAKAGYDYNNMTKRDLDFIRRAIAEIN